MQVLLSRMAGGLTAPEVAVILGKTTGAVTALQHRGLASLATVLALQSTARRQNIPWPLPTPITWRGNTNTKSETIQAAHSLIDSVLDARGAPS